MKLFLLGPNFKPYFGTFVWFLACGHRLAAAAARQRGAVHPGDGIDIDATLGHTSDTDRKVLVSCLASQ